MTETKTPYAKFYGRKGKELYGTIERLWAESPEQLQKELSAKGAVWKMDKKKADKELDEGSFHSEIVYLSEEELGKYPADPGTYDQKQDVLDHFGMGDKNV